MRSAIILAALLFCTTAYSADPETTLATEGLGPVKIGMTKRQAEAALGKKLRLQYSMTSDDNSCTYASRVDGKDRDIAYMLIHGKIARIDIGVKPAQNKILTAAGVGQGSTESAVKKAYGKRLQISPHPYGDDDNWHYLTVDEAEHTRGIIFETDGKRITSFRAGVYLALGYIEGCD